MTVKLEVSPASDGGLRKQIGSASVDLIVRGIGLTVTATSGGRSTRP